MSNYQYGKTIKTKTDVKSLVTNLIFWHNNYTEQSIVEETKKFLLNNYHIGRRRKGI